MLIFLLTNTVNIYRYSDEHLKHMLKDILKTDDLLCSEMKVKIF